MSILTTQSVMKMLSVLEPNTPTMTLCFCFTCGKKMTCEEVDAIPSEEFNESAPECDECRWVNKQDPEDKEFLNETKDVTEIDFTRIVRVRVHKIVKKEDFLHDHANEVDERYANNLWKKYLLSVRENIAKHTDVIQEELIFELPEEFVDEDCMSITSDEIMPDDFDDVIEEFKALNVKNDDE